MQFFIKTFLVSSLFFTYSVLAEPLQYYLPSGAVYDSTTQTPDKFVGHPIGDYHARHDRVIAYMEYIAEHSSRAQLINMGTSWEKRPQVLLVISSQENQAKVSKLLKDKQAFKNDANAPLVVWLGYSIHGNEASGTNASLLTAYHLAALQDMQHEQFLKDTIVIIEPSLNPDGYGRFSTWANNNRSSNMSLDPMDREHREDWPYGRTNHYRFDLNRDWLLAQHPESQNRLKWFHYFHPNVLGDFHEMGTNGTYFFQPGVPERQNPLTPDENFKITDAIAKHHAKALEGIGSLYYSKQNFDDFYYGKGSTYPDVQGSIGILFEQASARGHIQESINGPLSFSFAVRNHFVTSLSTLAGAYAQKDRLKDYRQKFFQQAETDSRNDSHRGVVISDMGDSGRMAALIDVLLRHQIKVYDLADSMTLDGDKFSSGILIPYQQKQYLLIKAMFETRTQFRDNTFYDVSTWNFGHAFNLPYQMVERRKWKDKIIGKQITQVPMPVGKVASKSNVAYVIDWNQFQSAKAVNQLMNDGIKVRMAGKKFKLTSSTGAQTFEPGSILVPVGIQSKDAESLFAYLSELAKQHHLEIDAIESGYALSGIDIGSPSMAPLKPIRPLMLTGGAVSTYDSGEIWHLLDSRLGMSLTQAKISQFGQLKLDRYSHLILAHGKYDSLKEKDVKRLKAWVQSGGVIIGIKSAAKWLSDNKLISGAVTKTSSDLNNDAERSYSEMDEDNAQRHIGGSIFETRVDQSHPLAFGIGRNELAVFKNHRFILDASDDPYQNLIRYTDEPLLSGYISAGNLENISKSVMMSAERKGRGSVIAIMDNPVFRGYWYGSSRLLVNSLFFGTAFNSPRL